MRRKKEESHYDVAVNADLLHANDLSRKTEMMKSSDLHSLEFKSPDSTFSLDHRSTFQKVLSNRIVNIKPLASLYEMAGSDTKKGRVTNKHFGILLVLF